MRRMTVVVEVTDGPPPVGAAAAAGYPADRGDGTERRRGNERRGSGEPAAPSSAAARPYGFRSFRDRRKGTGEPAFSPAEPGAGQAFRAAPTEDQIRVRIAAAYGDDGDGSSAILHRVDLCL